MTTNIAHIAAVSLTVSWLLDRSLKRGAAAVVFPGAPPFSTRTIYLQDNKKKHAIARALGIDGRGGGPVAGFANERDAPR
jgi:hypothetical protein